MPAEDDDEDEEEEEEEDAMAAERRSKKEQKGRKRCQWSGTSGKVSYPEISRSIVARPPPRPGGLQALLTSRGEWKE
jgi:hypothetical protein